MAVTAEQRARWARIVRRYEAGELMSAIAEQEGVDPKTVYNVARRAGLPNRHRFDEARRKRILDAYRLGQPIAKIARAERVHRTYVGHLAKRAGLPPRQGWARKYPLNERVFDKPDPVGWWLIGLIAADGSIRREANLITLTQAEKGIDVLHEFLAYVGCPARPLIELALSPEAAARAWPRSRAWEARIHSKHMCEVLGRHGIKPRKSKDLRLGPEASSKAAVWLGLLDGDGWVSVNGAHRRRPRLDFFGTPAVMRQCSEFWGRHLTFRGTSRPTVGRHAGGLGRVCLHGGNAARAAEILLAASPTMARKRRILEQIVATERLRPGFEPPAMRTSVNA